ncbi:flagellar protein FlaG [Alteromonas sp. CYL-A6]|uniref:flagellar protein FlaG n=1 Tax=Alteromonas nitratireducens TaxID=3390813 RepID=UPI0034B3A055
MEIANIQNGQALASNTNGNSVRNDATETRVRQQETPLRDVASRETSTPQSVGETVTRASQNTVQVSEQQADTENREDRSVQLNEAVKEVEAFLQAQNRNLAFTIDEDTNRSVVTVKDGESGDVIRQIPSEEVLKLAERIQELQQDIGNRVGVLINNKV